MYLLNQPIRAVFCGDNSRNRLDIIPAGALLHVAGPSTFPGMVEIFWQGIQGHVFLTDLEDRSDRPLPATA